MTDFVIYSKALCVSAAATFGVVWCVLGFEEAFFDVVLALVSLLVISAVLASSVTLTFIFYDWKNRNEESDSS